MTGDSLPDDHHVAHYFGRAATDEDGRPALHAFLPRQSETYLSVNWMEYFKAPSRTAAIECVRRVLRTRITVKRSGKLWVLNVGAAKEAARGAGNEMLCVEHQPEDGDLSHAGIGGYTGDDMVVAAALQSLVHDDEHLYSATVTDSR